MTDRRNGEVKRLKRLKIGYEMPFCSDGTSKSALPIAGKTKGGSEQKNTENKNSKY